MINAEAIGRAERTLQIVYQDKHVPRQLMQMEVEMVDFNNFLAATTQIAERRIGTYWHVTDPRIHQAYNTLLMHMFLCGLIAGRNEAKGE